MLVLCSFLGVASAPEKTREDLFATTLGQIDAYLAPILQELDVSEEDRAQLDAFTTMVNEIAQKLGTKLTEDEAERLFDWWLPVWNQLIKDCESDQARHPNPTKALIIADLKSLHTHVRALHAEGSARDTVEFLAPIFAITDSLPPNLAKSGLNIEILLNVSRINQGLLQNMTNAAKGIRNVRHYTEKAVTIFASRTTNWLVSTTGWSRDMCVLLVGLGGPYAGFVFSTLGAFAMDYQEWKRNCTGECGAMAFAWETFNSRGIPYLPHMFLGTLQALCMEYTMPYYCVLIAVLSWLCQRMQSKKLGRSVGYVVLRTILLAVQGFRYLHIALVLALFVGGAAMTFRVWLAISWYHYGWALPVLRQENVKASVQALYDSLSSHLSIKILVMCVLFAAYYMRNYKIWCDDEKNSANYLNTTRNAAKNGSKKAPASLRKAYAVDRYLSPLHWLLCLQGFVWPLAAWVIPKVAPLLGMQWVVSLIHGLEQVGELDFADGGMQYFVALWNLISLGQ